MTELEFWEAVYVAAVNAGHGSPVATAAAAVENRRNASRRDGTVWTAADRELERVRQARSDAYGDDV